ncbi:sensor histidine kinase KdpD [uncultured Eubacterium sp.]|uniref:sensor histidine kinase n=1 Tax=uncultured Eubacterium sp. TaxID=165185 RepID=UPI0025977965|nr:HAMP domain-containing sensor histidine kinase [uncultured Eubacterium sp.]
MKKTGLKITIFIEIILILATVLLIFIYDSINIKDLTKTANDVIEDYYERFVVGGIRDAVPFFDTSYQSKVIAYKVESDDKILKDLDSLNQKKIDKHNKAIKYLQEDYKYWQEYWQNYDYYKTLNGFVNDYKDEIDEMKSTKNDNEYKAFAEKMEGLEARVVRVGKNHYVVKGYKPYYKEEMSFGLSPEEVKESNAEKGMCFCYVDLTSDYAFIDGINKIIIFTAIILGLIALISAMIIGRRIDKNAIVQRKFFENTSHELKTPLASIKGYSEGLRKGVIVDGRKTSDIISKQIDKLSKLIDDIVSVAKLESGMTKLNKEQISSSDFIQDCIMPFEGAVRDKKLEVNLNLGDGSINIDIAQFEHAFNNIFTNALKYAQSKINISCDNKKIRIWNDCREISEEDVSHIFDRFYIGKNGNTGIGLALAKDIINYHGFRINANRYENGVEFVISIG